jgi:hypothetical protein
MIHPMRPVRVRSAGTSTDSSGGTAGGCERPAGYRCSPVTGARLTVRIPDTMPGSPSMVVPGHDVSITRSSSLTHPSVCLWAAPATYKHPVAVTMASDTLSRHMTRRGAPSSVRWGTTLGAIGELIALGEQEGFGITFNPDPEGWTVDYLRGMGGGELLSGFDLGDTARAAVRPLLELSARYGAARRDREGHRGE